MILRWKIKFDQRAKKEFDALSSQLKARVESYFKRAVALNKDPRNFGRPFAYDRFGLWQYRIEGLQLICKISPDEAEMNILKLSRKKLVF